MRTQPSERGREPDRVFGKNSRYYLITLARQGQRFALCSLSTRSLIAAVQFHDPPCGDSVALTCSWALATFGNTGAFNIVGPKFFQFDLAFVREFRVYERSRLQIRAEAFNVFNNVRLNNPTAAQGLTLSASTTFGTITSAQDPRILQLAMKFVF